MEKPKKTAQPISIHSIGPENSPIHPPSFSAQPQDPPEFPGWNYAATRADKFKLPAVFPTEAEVLYLPQDVPTIVVNQLALLKILILVDAIDLEVGWLGTAKRVGSDFLVGDVFIFEQDVSHGHTELSTDSMSEIMSEVLTRPDGEEIFNNTRFWGHSHGDGGVYPSSQDDSQMKLFEGFGADFFLRGIFNRRGEINFSLYDYQRGLAFHHTPWKVGGEKVSHKTYEMIRTELREGMRKKVVYLPPPPPPPVYIARAGLGFFRKWKGKK